VVGHGEGADPRAWALGGGPVRGAQRGEGAVAAAGGRAESGVEDVVGVFEAGLGGDGGGRSRTGSGVPARGTGRAHSAERAHRAQHRGERHAEPLPGGPARSPRYAPVGAHERSCPRSGYPVHRPRHENRPVGVGRGRSLGRSAGCLARRLARRSRRLGRRWRSGAPVRPAAPTAHARPGRVRRSPGSERVRCDTDRACCCSSRLEARRGDAPTPYGTFTRRRPSWLSRPPSSPVCVPAPSSATPGP